MIVTLLNSAALPLLNLSALYSSACMSEVCDELIACLCPGWFVWTRYCLTWRQFFWISGRDLGYFSVKEQGFKMFLFGHETQEYQDTWVIQSLSVFWLSVIFAKSSTRIVRSEISELTVTMLSLSDFVYGRGPTKNPLIKKQQPRRGSMMSSSNSMTNN